MYRKSNDVIRVILAGCFCFVLFSCGTEKHPIPKPQKHQGPSEEALTQWKNQRFSMFIHFGLYSLAGGVWEGKPVKIGYSEQIRAHGKIPKNKYRALANQFNPVKWNADSIASLAKSAGMRGIVITAKHHDGFSLFKTNYSKFNIVDATPYKKDLIAGLSEACKRHGLKFGVYFSLIDWDFDGAEPISNHNSDSIPPAHHLFNLGQVEELLSNYGPISEIWFDMGKPTITQSQQLASLVHRLQPDCMVSGRIWNDQGDFAVMGDNASPDFKMNTPWQAPASMFDETWGYRSWQKRGEPKVKAEEKIKSLINVVANGGNYLLNIGPMGDGSVVPFEKSVLNQIGEWIKFQSHSILNDQVLDHPKQSWGVALNHSDQIKLYLLKFPAKNSFVIEGLKSKIKSIKNRMDPKQIFEFKSTNQGILVTFKKGTLNPFLVSVLDVEIEDKPLFQPVGILSFSGNSLNLNFQNAMRYHSFSGKDYYSTKPTVVKMDWNIQSNKDQLVNLEFLIPKSNDPLPIQISIHGQSYMVHFSDKRIKEHYQISVLSGIKLNQGVNQISLQSPDQSNPHRDLGLDNLIITIN